MNGGALQDALEAGRRLRVLGRVDQQHVELVIEIFGNIPAQLLKVDAAGAENRDRVLVFRQRQQQVLERGVFVIALAGKAEGAMETLFEIARQHGVILVLLKRAAKRMLMLPGKIHDLRHLRLRYFIGIDAADAHPSPVNVQHDPRRLLPALREEPLEDMYDELHGREIVIQHQNLRPGHPPPAPAGHRGHARAGVADIAVVLIAHGRTQYYTKSV